MKLGDLAKLVDVIVTWQTLAVVFMLLGFIVHIAKGGGEIQILASISCGVLSLKEAE